MKWLPSNQVQSLFMGIDHASLPGTYEVPPTSVLPLIADLTWIKPKPSAAGLQGPDIYCKTVATCCNSSPRVDVARQHRPSFLIG